jgi:hypothetical protein
MFAVENISLPGTKNSDTTLESLKLQVDIGAIEKWSGKAPILEYSIDLGRDN